MRRGLFRLLSAHLHTPGNCQEVPLWVDVPPLRGPIREQGPFPRAGAALQIHNGVSRVGLGLGTHLLGHVHLLQSTTWSTLQSCHATCDFLPKVNDRTAWQIQMWSTPALLLLQLLQNAFLIRSRGQHSGWGFYISCYAVFTARH